MTNWGHTRRILFGLVVALMWPATIGTAPAQTLILPDSASLEIEVSKGILIRLDRPATQIFIADSEIADVQVKSSRLVYIFGKAPGQTTFYAVGENDDVIVRRDVAVNHNLTRLRNAIAQLVPDATIRVSSIEGSILLSGEVDSASEAETVRALAQRVVKDKSQIINRIAVTGPNQINLRVRVAEMSRDTAKKLGFSFSALSNLAGSASIGMVTGIAGGLVDGLLPDQSSFNWSPSGGSISAVIDALENEGLITTLAEPNLTALSGETATFLVGGEFPIPVAQRDNRVSIEFKEFGVKLAFTPTLVGGGRVSLRVRPEISALTTNGAINTGGIQIPALTMRRAETTVELGSGQSFAIAGLLQNSIQHDLRKFPGLGDLPLVGALFRSDQFVRNETELVIIVTPYTVRPISTKVATPLDGYAPPNDLERYLEGKRFRPALPSPGRGPLALTRLGLIGPAGFVID